MKERPILFSGPMVRAILSGAKTQTRRVVKPQPGMVWGHGVALPGNTYGVPSDVHHAHVDMPDGKRRFILCPFGQPGDRLWVRETFWEAGRWWQHGEYGDDPRDYTWSSWRTASFEPQPTKDGKWRKRPSIHMPRWASRLTLEVTGVRVERLHDISEEDARAEGMQPCHVNGEPYCPAVAQGRPHRLLFALTWDELYGTWDQNPWVWVIEFRRVQ